MIDPASAAVLTGAFLYFSFGIYAAVLIERKRHRTRRLGAEQRAIVQFEEAAKIAEKKAYRDSAVAKKEAEKEAILMLLESPQLGHIDDLPEGPGDGVADPFRGAT